MALRGRESILSTFSCHLSPPVFSVFAALAFFLQSSPNSIKLLCEGRCIPSRSVNESKKISLIVRLSNRAGTPGCRMSRRWRMCRAVRYCSVCWHPGTWRLLSKLVGFRPVACPGRWWAQGPAPPAEGSRSHQLERAAAPFTRKGRPGLDPKHPLRSRIARADIFTVARYSSAVITKRSACFTGCVPSYFFLG